MSEPFLAEVRIIGFNFPPRGWAFCDGQLLPVHQNQSLYSLLGTIYGGDGRTEFALPDLRGRVPIHVGGDHRQGQKSGEETHTLTINEMPYHDHVLQASSQSGDAPIPSGFVLAQPNTDIYGSPNQLVDLKPGTVANTGGGQAHENMQPFLTVNFVIALQGKFPPRN